MFIDHTYILGCMAWRVRTCVLTVGRAAPTTGGSIQKEITCVNLKFAQEKLRIAQRFGRVSQRAILV
jgi:hypothetical protein